MTQLAKPWKDSSIAANGATVQENFIQWFDRSAIVGLTGEPHACWHGTRARELFDAFVPSRGGAQGPGVYLSSHRPADGEGYGAHSFPVYVRMLRPFVFHPSDDSIDADVNGDLLEQLLDAETVARVIDRIGRLGVDEGYGDELTQALKARGHDGIVMVYPKSDGSRGEFLRTDCVIIAMDATQLKSADRNCGLYVPDSPSLTDLDAQAMLLRQRKRMVRP